MRFSNKVENIFIWNGPNGRHQCNGPLHIVDESAAGFQGLGIDFTTAVETTRARYRNYNISEPNG